MSEEKKSVFLTELEKREKILAEHGNKVARLAEIEEERAKLEADIAEYNPVDLQLEIDELLEACYERGLREKPIEEVGEETAEETAQAESIATQPVAVPLFQ